MTDAHGERIARMETKLEYVQEKVADLAKKIDDIEAKQDQLIDLITEAKGGLKVARWLYGVAAVAGGFVIAYWSSIKALLTKVGG
jgi:phage shock protein A